MTWISSCPLSLVLNSEPRTSDSGPSSAFDWCSILPQKTKALLSQWFHWHPVMWGWEMLSLFGIKQLLCCSHLCFQEYCLSPSFAIRSHLSLRWIWRTYQAVVVQTEIYSHDCWTDFVLQYLSLFVTAFSVFLLSCHGSCCWFEGQSLCSKASAWATCRQQSYLDRH